MPQEKGVNPSLVERGSKRLNEAQKVGRERNCVRFSYKKRPHELKQGASLQVVSWHRSPGNIDLETLEG